MTQAAHDFFAGLGPRKDAYITLLGPAFVRVEEQCARTGKFPNGTRMTAEQIAASAAEAELWKRELQRIAHKWHAQNPQYMQKKHLDLFLMYCPTCYIILRAPGKTHEYVCDECGEEWDTESALELSDMVRLRLRDETESAIERIEDMERAAARAQFENEWLERTTTPPKPKQLALF